MYGEKSSSEGGCPRGPGAHAVVGVPQRDVRALSPAHATLGYTFIPNCRITLTLLSFPSINHTSHGGSK